jgi:hypothetical protein
MANIERRVVIDTKQPEAAAVSLRAAFRLPEQQIESFISTLKALESEATKLNTTGLSPTKDGLAKLSAGFRSTASEAEQMIAVLRQLQQAQLRANVGVAGSAEAAAAERAERVTGLRQIAAAQEDVNRAIKSEAAERRLGLQQISAVGEEAKRQAQTDAAERKLGIQQVTAAQEDLNRAVKAEAEQRVLARQQIAAQGQNLKVDAAKQFQQIPVNPIDAFNRAMLGGADGVAKFRENMISSQESARVFSSVLTANPIQALKTLITDSQAAGAATAFFKSQLDFVINSRFGTIALGFAVFGTIASIIKSATATLIEFQDKFARIQALSVGHAGAFKANAEDLHFLQQAAKESGVALGELADKYLTARSATQSQATAQALFTNALQFSKASGADFGETLLALSGILNAFGGQLGKNLTEQEKLAAITSLLFNVFNRSTGTANDFVAAMSMVGSTANAMNVPFDKLLGLLGVLNDEMVRGSKGGRGLRQEFLTIVREADKFNEVFNLGLSKRDIIAHPLAAMEALAQKIREGAISAEKFKALAADLFPTNALSVFFALFSTNIDAINTKYADLVKTTVDIGAASKGTFGTIAAEFGKLKTNLALTIDAGGLFTDQLSIGMKAINFVVGELADHVAALGGSLKATLLFATGHFEEAKAASRGVVLNLLDMVGQAHLLDAPTKTFKEAMVEVEKSLLDFSQGQKTTIKDEAKLTDQTDLELQLARGIEISLQRQLEIRRQIVDTAVKKTSAADLLDADKEKAAQTEIKARADLERTAIQGLREENERLIIQSDKLTEARRSDAVITQAIATEEIRARRGIIAALQQQQGELLREIEIKDISGRQGQQLFDQFQKQINAQLQAIHQVGEAARRSAEQREAAEHRVLQAAERLADLQTDRAAQISQEGRRGRDLIEDRALLEERQADQRIDAENRVGKTRDTIDRALREQADQHRKTLEQQALGQVRLLLGFPEQANALLLTQLDRIRQAQVTANLPLHERITLLEKEFWVLDKIKSKEESRLDQAILFGSQLEAIQEAERQAVEAFLASDPARQAAAERKARLQFGRVTRETIAAAAGPAIGITGLEPENLSERKRQTDELLNIDKRRVDLGKLINQDLAVQMEERAKIEKEAADKVKEAFASLADAQRDQQRLAHEHARQIRASNEAIADAQAARIKNERTFAINLREAIREQQRAQQDAQRFQGAGPAGRPDLPQQIQNDAALLKKQQQIEADRAKLADINAAGAAEAARKGERFVPIIGPSELTPAEVINATPIFRLPDGTFTNSPREASEILDRVRRDFQEGQQRALEEQRKGGDIPFLPQPGFRRESFAPEGAAFAESFRRAAIETDLSGATAMASTLQKIGEIKTALASLPHAVDAATRRAGDTLVSRVSDEILDEIRRELDFPTG